MNSLYYGDNLILLKYLAKRYPAGWVDLIYIDPPFNSNRNYHHRSIPPNSPSTPPNLHKHEVFRDTWSHVDSSTELAEIKTLAQPQLYAFLGNNSFLSPQQSNYLTLMALRIYYMHKILKPTASFYLHCDPTMSHYLKILCDIVFGTNLFQNELIWTYGLGGSSPQRFSKKHDVILFYTKTTEYTFNKPMMASTSSKMKGQEKGMLDVWSIPSLNNMAKERIGYPTQKPEALLERILRASSNEGDLVADFFCGGGTTLAVAEKLNRHWLGCDISHLAIKLIEELRLKKLAAVYNIKTL